MLQSVHAIADIRPPSQNRQESGMAQAKVSNSTRTTQKPQRKRSNAALDIEIDVFDLITDSVNIEDYRAFCLGLLPKTAPQSASGQMAGARGSRNVRQRKTQ